MMRIVYSVLFLLLLSVPLAVAETSSADAQWRPLKERLAREGFDRGYLEVLFQRDMVVFMPGIMARKMDALTETMVRRRKGEKSPVPHEERAELYGHYTRPDLMATAREFMRSRKALFDRVEREYGVPREIMVALLQVETKLGTLVGKERVFINLASMAASTETEMFLNVMTQAVPADAKAQAWFKRRTRDKADWAFKEVVALIRYAQANRQDPLSILGSHYGAIGYCQFMPTNAISLGRDGNGDGMIDLFHEADAVASMANYLRNHGWKGKMTPQKRYKAIFAYNHSKYYTKAILAIADELTAGQ